MKLFNRKNRQQKQSSSSSSSCSSTSQRSIQHISSRSSSSSSSQSTNSLVDISFTHTQKEDQPHRQDPQKLNSDLDIPQHTSTTMFSSSSSSSSSPLMEQQPQPQSAFSLLDLYKMDCAPGLVLMSDDDESSSLSSFASCGTVSDVEDLFGSLQQPKSPTATNKKRVRFSCVRVREYSRTVGDQNIRLPLSLGWSYGPEQRQMIDDEDESSMRSQHHHQQQQESYNRNSNSRRQRRRRRHFKLDYWQRREILQCFGNFTSTELTKIEQRRNQDAVSDFLEEAAHALDYGYDGDDGDNLMDGKTLEASLAELVSSHSRCCEEGEGIEVGVEPIDGFGLSRHELSYLELERPFEWQMTVQVLED